MSDDQLGVMLEDMQGKLQGLAEAVSAVRQDVAVMKPQLARIEENTSDLQIMKTVVTGQSKQLYDPEERLQVLEMPERA